MSLLIVVIPVINYWSVQYVTNVGSECIFRTNKNAPNYRLVSINLENPSMDQWRTLVEEDSKDVLDWAVNVHGDKLILCYIHDVKVGFQTKTYDRYNKRFAFRACSKSEI
jgi:protease II